MIPISFRKSETVLADFKSNDNQLKGESYEYRGKDSLGHRRQPRRR